MNHKKIDILLFGRLFCFFLVYATPVSAVLPASVYDLFPIRWTGTDKIRGAEYTAALEAVRNDTATNDTAFHFFKLGLINHKLQNHTIALPYLRLAAQQSALLAPVMYALLGDYTFAQNDIGNAFNAYVAALDPDCPEEYHKYIYTKIKAILEKDSTITLENTRLDGFRQWYTSIREKTKPPIVVMIDSLLQSSAWRELDSLLATSNLPGSALCAQVQAIAENDTLKAALRSSSLLTCARIAFSCKNFKLANQFLDNIAKKRDTTRTINASALYLRAQIAYDSNRPDEAIRHFKRYISRYDTTSDILMYIARSYRKKENFLETNKWYNKHVQMFPTHSKTLEILWLQAWQFEDRKKYSSAGAIYKKLYTKFTSGSRRDESYLRHALCYFRQEKYDSSIVILSTLLKKYPTTNFFSAATFWKAKNLLSIEKYTEAIKCFHDVINYDPFEYYSFRSRYNLTLMGDSVRIVIDSLTDILQTYHWFDSITPAQQRTTLTAVDSLNYRRGVLCASLGLIELADPFLSNIEKKSGLDLALQYEIALLYSLCNAPAHAYRIARRFAWRIPQKYRKTAPLPAFMLLYPAFFSKTIHDEAKTQNIDPNLVSAVIRQESIFDPQIVSPAGAIGLMQIMPYTGVELAKKLNMPFETDSLYNPLYNVKLGTFYLQDLLNDFNGNLVLVLSSYNAGPHNAKKWYQKNKKEEFDLFVEDIEFTETRGYVKKVLANYWTYQELSLVPAYLENYTPGYHQE